MKLLAALILMYMTGKAVLPTSQGRRPPKTWPDTTRRPGGPHTRGLPLSPKHGTPRPFPLRNRCLTQTWDVSILTPGPNISSGAQAALHASFEITSMVACCRTAGKVLAKMSFISAGSVSDRPHPTTSQEPPTAGSLEARVANFTVDDSWILFCSFRSRKSLLTWKRSFRFKIYNFGKSIIIWNTRLVSGNS